MSICGIIFDLKKYAIHDGPGIRTTVFFKGCPLECWWCHNPEGCRSGREKAELKSTGHGPEKSPAERVQCIGREWTVDEVMLEIRKDRVFYDQSGGGVTFSGGEPMMQVDFLAALLRACRRDGITTAVDTCGYAAGEDFEKIAALADLFLYDLKLLDDQLHRKYTGGPNRIILDNLKELSRCGANVTIRIPLIPGITDTDGNLEAIVRFLMPLSGIRDVSLLPYNQFGADKLRRYGMADRLGNVQSQTNADIDRAARRFRDHGYRVKIGG